MRRFLLEQPQGSTAPLHPRLEEIFDNEQVYRIGMWGGKYSENRADCTPKRHIMISNDVQLLRELNLAAGNFDRGEMAQFTGEPLVKRTRREDGTEYWSGNGATMTRSQPGPQGEPSAPAHSFGFFSFVNCCLQRRIMKNLASTCRS